MTRILTGFAGSTVAIDCDGEPAARLAARLFGTESSSPSAEPDIRYRLVWDAADGNFELSAGPDARVQRGPTAHIAALLLERAGYDLADRCRHGLVLHAASVRGGGRVLLLPGPSGSGKSTFSAWLGTHGFEWLGDELAFVPAGTTECEPFPRPLGLKGPARSILREHLHESLAEGRIFSLPGMDYVTGFATGNGPDRSRPLGGIIFPAFDDGAATVDLAPLSPARAAHRLLGCLLNARNLPGHGVTDVIRLASAVPAAVLVFGSLETAAAAARTWWGTGISAPGRAKAV